MQPPVRRATFFPVRDKEMSWMVALPSAKRYGHKRLRDIKRGGS